MNYWFGAIVLFITSLQGFSQKLIGFQISPGVTITRVNDKDPHPSNGLNGQGFLRNPADGYTSKESNQSALTAGLNYDVSATDKVYLSTGIWFTSKKMMIRNTDGNYSGVSTYETVYMQIPLALKLYLVEFEPAFRLYLKTGFSLDLKLKESLHGGDGAHYWNLAKNMYWNDYTRGRNGDNKPMALFNPLNIGFLGALGLEYALSDQWFLFAGLSYNAGLLNTINPSLRHNDVNRTKVAQGLSIRTHAFTADVGVSLKIK